MTRAWRTSILTWVGLCAAGCAGSVSHMTAVANVNTAASANEAVVVFMRPSGMAFAIQSSVFEVPSGQPSRLVGIVAAKKKVAYRAAPGEHTFMVVGESADFMSAQLAPGKTYYAIVTPRMGAMKARFSLKPVKAADRSDLADWQGGTEWVELNQESAAWAQENAGDIEGKRTKYFAEWMAKAPADRPMLAAEDAP